MNEIAIVGVCQSYRIFVRLFDATCDYVWWLIKFGLAMTNTQEHVGIRQQFN